MLSTQKSLINVTNFNKKPTFLNLTAATLNLSQSFPQPHSLPSLRLLIPNLAAVRALETGMYLWVWVLTPNYFPEWVWTIQGEARSKK